jgi:predicted O-methyltransferase YrrM
MSDFSRGGGVRQDRSVDQVPQLVERARELAREVGFPLTKQESGPDRASASLPGVGQFLGVLAAGCHGGRIAEIGTGAGIGTAWMASMMPADCTLVTAEIDERLAAVAASLLAADPRVEVLIGDARELLAPRAPFADPRLVSAEVVLPDLRNSLLVGTRRS